MLFWSGVLGLCGRPLLTGCPLICLVKLTFYSDKVHSYRVSIKSLGFLCEVQGNGIKVLLCKRGNVLKNLPRRQNIIQYVCIVYRPMNQKYKVFRVCILSMLYTYFVGFPFRVRDNYNKGRNSTFCIFHRKKKRKSSNRKCTLRYVLAFT